MNRAFFSNSLLVLILVLMACPGCHRRQYRTLVVSVPQLKGEACAALIRDRLLSANERAQSRELLFFKSVEADVAAKTVRVTYNSEVTAGMNVLHSIAALGFDCSDAADPKRASPGNPVARKKLPADCQ